MDDHVSYLLNFCNAEDQNRYFDGSESEEELFSHLDAFCEILQYRLDRKYFGKWKDFCEMNKSYCFRSRECKQLPWETRSRCFIPKIIHAIQDWGLCYRYLCFRVNPIHSTEQLLNEMKANVAITLGEEGQRGGTPKTLCQKMRIRTENIIFLRQFDIDCCHISSRFTEEHEHFVRELRDFMDTVLNAYERREFFEVDTSPIERIRRRDSTPDLRSGKRQRRN
jgi:hypothetical protein